MSNLSRLLVKQSPNLKYQTVEIVTVSALSNGLSEAEAAWVLAAGFEAKVGTLCCLPAADGSIARILAGAGTKKPTASDPWWLAAIAANLGPGTYKIIGVSEKTVAAGAFAWCLEQYKFDRYLSTKKPNDRILVLGTKTNLGDIADDVEGAALTRDLINTPTEDMGPGDLQDAAEALAETYGGRCGTIVGDDLLEENFPAIHAVGRAAALGREPRLIDLTWGDNNHPKITLVGKGVCFDTGGLDLKPAAGMRLMKKDMGGAAHALGLARMIMARGLKVRLRVLVPAVENAVAGNAFRPGDILATRKGLSVEIGNTDAEGRLVLCDALALASEEKPDLIIDFATLTGAARTALGPDLPATFVNNENLWRLLETGAAEKADPLWRMPLWQPYAATLESPIADLNNIANTGLGGAITAALYLQNFVSDKITWAHLDVFGWAPTAQPGRGKGGAAQGLRASMHAIEKFIAT